MKASPPLLCQRAAAPLLFQPGAPSPTALLIPSVPTRNPCPCSARGRGGQALNSPRCGDGWFEAQQRDGGSSADVRSGGRLHLGSEKTKEALLELKAVLENNPKVVAHYPVEVRFARGDDILLSPCFQRDSCYMNIIMYR